MDKTAPMTIEKARAVIQSRNPESHDLQNAILTLSLSSYFGDQMVAFELRKAQFFKSKESGWL